MKEYKVTITETLKKVVVVEAEDEIAAAQIASDAWHKGEYVLDADNFTGVAFETEGEA